MGEGGGGGRIYIHRKFFYLICVHNFEDLCLL